MIETGIDHILEKETGKINSVSENAIGKIRQMKETFKDRKEVIETMDFYMMLRKLGELKTERVGEFRKNVALKIQFRGQEVVVNLEQLKIYAEMLEKFINFAKEILM